MDKQTWDDMEIVLNKFMEIIKKENQASKLKFKYSILPPGTEVDWFVLEDWGVQAINKSGYWYVAVMDEKIVAFISPELKKAIKLPDLSNDDLSDDEIVDWIISQ